MGMGASPNVAHLVIVAPHVDQHKVLARDFRTLLDHAQDSTPVNRRGALIPGRWKHIMPGGMGWAFGGRGHGGSIDSVDAKWAVDETRGSVHTLPDDAIHGT